MNRKTTWWVIGLGVLLGLLAGLLANHERRCEPHPQFYNQAQACPEPPHEPR